MAPYRLDAPSPVGLFGTEAVRTARIDSRDTVRNRTLILTPTARSDMGAPANARLASDGVTMINDSV